MSTFSGALGEVFAARYLRDEGYDIRTANYRTRLGEIDVIAEKKGELVFVEVKTRSEGMLASPAESVDRRKRQRLTRCAMQYLRQEQPDCRTRFDVIEVYLDARDRLVRISHIPNAFDSEL